MYVQTIDVLLPTIRSDVVFESDQIRDAGFENAKYRNLTMGVAALHSGWKI